VVRDAVRRWTQELNQRLNAIRTAADWDDAHAARISVKRTRYLLKPFEEELRAAGDALEQLTALQDVLGALQDARVLADELRAGMVEIGAERARRLCDELLPWSAAAQATSRTSLAAGHPGLVALAHRLGAEYEATFDRLRGRMAGAAGTHPALPAPSARRRPEPETQAALPRARAPAGAAASQ
jgi:hypothetical protein